MTCNYRINSIWLSEQQAAQIFNFDCKHQRYLAAMQYKIREDYPWARHSSLRFFTTITTQNRLIKWKSDFWTYTTRHVGRAG